MRLSEWKGSKGVYGSGCEMKQKSKKKDVETAAHPPHEYRVLEDRFMTEMDLKG